MKKNLWMLFLIAGFGLSGMKVVLADGAWDASQQNNEPTGGGWGGPSYSRSNSSPSSSNSNNDDDLNLNEDNDIEEQVALGFGGTVLAGIASWMGYKLLKKPAKRARKRFSDFRTRRSKEYKLTQDERVDKINSGVDNVDTDKYSPYVWQDYDEKMTQRRKRNFARLERAEALHKADDERNKQAQNKHNKQAQVAAQKINDMYVAAKASKTRNQDKVLKSRATHKRRKRLGPSPKNK